MKEVLYIWNLPSYWSSVALAHVLWCVCVCVFSYRCCLCVPDNTLIINRLWDAVHSSEVRLMLTATITASPVMWRMTHRCTQSTYKPRLRCVCVCVCVFCPWGSVEKCLFSCSKALYSAVTDHLQIWACSSWCVEAATETLLTWPHEEICSIFIRLVTGSWFEECIDIQKCIYKLTCHYIM